MKQQDIQDLKELIEFLKEYEVAEFDLDRGDLKIRLKFTPAGEAPAGQSGRAGAGAGFGCPASPSSAAAAPACGSCSSRSGSCRCAAAEENLHIVKSPIVGTFYGSPSPGASAFVSPGDRVEKGQVICIVEAMKLMNEIEADAAGEIVKCLVTNGQPIEFGQPLFAIRAS